MRKSIKISIVAFVALMAMSLFQNCNKIKVSEVGASDAGILGSPESTGMTDGGGMTGTVVIDGSTANDLVKECEERAIKAREGIPLADGASITDTHGNMFFKGNRVGLIKNVHGNFHILGTGPDSSIEVLDSVHGNMVICGMDIKEIRNQTHGNLYIVHGDVGNIIGFHGNLRLIGGKITGNISNSHGNLNY